MDSTLSFPMRAARRPCPAIAGAVLSCLLGAVGPARADAGQPDGMVALSNGALVEWRIEEGGDGPLLGLSVPAFAQWTRSAFDAPVTVRMRSEGLGTVDAWQLAFYRAGDTDFARPMRRFRGDARSLDTPVEWDGRVESGPPLRPGETVVARFETRDVAGNIDRAAPQEMLVARYAMRTERRDIAAVGRARALMLAEGEAPVPRGIPVRGSVLAMTVTDWLDEEGPSASGVRLRKRGKGWTLRQTLPPGRHEVVIESTRPILGGMRSIPVGAMPVVSPAAPPFHAGVKGSGHLAKSPVTADALFSDTVLPDAMVPGKAAISRPLTNREGREDRLALALIDADAPVTLSVDRRKRMALLSEYAGTTAAWPGGSPVPGSDRDPVEPARRRVGATLAVAPTLALPHVDIVPDSLSLSAGGDGTVLKLFRDYFVDAAEGRILLTPSALGRLSATPGATVVASYAVPVFGADALAQGEARDDTWASAAAARRVVPASPREETAFGSALRRLFGGG